MKYLNNVFQIYSKKYKIREKIKKFAIMVWLALYALQK